MKAPVYIQDLAIIQRLGNVRENYLQEYKKK